MKRPIPVILSAIFLGLLAALQLGGTAAMAGIGFFVLHKGLPGPQPPMLFPHSFLPVLFFGMSLFAAALAVWSILTLIGLVRLRSWARYSLLVIAGCITVFAGMGSLMSFAMPFLASSVAPQPPGANPAILHGAFLLIGVIYGLFALIGIALLVYFNLANTHALFLPNAPVNLSPPNTSTGRPRPTAITVISWMYLLSAPFCLIYFLLPFPAMLFGFIFYGMAAHLLYASFGMMAFVIGYGLYRLWNWARIAIYAMFGVGLVNALVLVTPWGRSQFHAYMDAFNTHMYSYGGHTPTPNIAASAVGATFGACFGLAFCGVILWLLHRHRIAFTPLPPPPPMPPQPEALPG